MRIEGNALIALLIGDRSADRIVPRSGLTAWLTLFAAGAMAFLAVFALALALTTERIARTWGEELARGATVRVGGAAEEMPERVASAVRVLQTTPGVAAVRVLTDADQAALLAPWLGPDLPIDSLPLPRLIALDVAEDFDGPALVLRLEGEVPGAVLDDHARWRAPLIAAAFRVRLTGIAAVVLIAAVTAAIITLAARASLATNATTIGVLRLIGARDVYIARAFVRRLTLRAIAGAAAGTVLGALAVALLPPGQEATGLLAAFGFIGWQWLWLLVLPFAAGFVAFWASRTAALSVLGKTA